MACSVRTAAIIACPLLLGAADAGAAAAPGYPVKPIRLIVPFPPGGSVDAVGRLVGQKLQESVGQPVVIDNRAGAGGIVASELTARALGITGRKRSHLVPHLPTLLEQGVTGFESGPWYALVGPAGVPHFIVARLHQQLVSILKTSDMREKFSAQGAEPVGGTPAELTETMKNELAKWARLVKEIGLRAD